MSIEIPIEVCREGVEIPKYARKGDAGVDVTNACDDIIMYPGITNIIHTGIKLAIPNGYEVQVRPRSGLSYLTKLRVANSPGTLDSSFRGEVGVIIENIGDMPITIKNGDRIAQLVLNKVPMMEFKKVDSVEGIGYNRGGGFGSTGK